MSKHKLSAGAVFIENIRNIGTILGYHVELEYPINNNIDHGSAVDIAWFSEEGQRFPLFIFEIESVASNSMVYNPMKVFAKSNEIFEKPLFLFQIVISQGQNSSRVEDLKNLYGTYNYRIYRVAANEGSKLIFDILSQHRRLSTELNIVLLVDYLITSEWLSFDSLELLKFIQELNFEKGLGNFLPAIAFLSLKFPLFSSFFCRFLNSIYGAQIDYEFWPNYSSYLGRYYCIPIHLGIRAISSNDIREKAFCLERFKIWQTNGEHLSIIGPHFGLSQDYDNFIVNIAGGLLGLLSALFREIEAARLYFCEELQKIIEATAIEYRSLNFLWLIHIAPNSRKGDIFKERAVQHFKQCGYFSYDALRHTPFYGNDEITNTINHSSNCVPELLNLKNIIAPLEIDDSDITKAAIQALISNHNDKNFSSIIIHALHNKESY